MANVGDPFSLMEALRLTFPAQQQGQHLMVETRPEALKRWLEGLPYGDMKRTVPQVSQAIASLNRTEVSVNQRAELVALFDHTYELISDYYRPKIVLRPRGQQFAGRAETDELSTLTREMSFAHKMLVIGLIEKRSFWSKEKPLTRAVNLAIHYLSVILLEHYETYSPVPVYVWRELNALFSYASEHKLEQVEALPEHYKHCMATIQDNYVRACLISLANPYQMDRGEHWEMNKYLAHWTPLAKISADPDDFTKRNCFVVDLSGEAKPRYGVNALEDPEDPRIRLLITHDLTLKLTQQIEDLEREHQLPSPGFYPGLNPQEALNLLQRMSSHWDFRVERHAPRYPVINQLDVIWGLQQIHQVLTWQDPLSPNADPEARNANRLTLAKKLERDDPQELRWDAVNASDGGICLTQHHDAVDYLRVGQLAAMREYVDGHPTMRWVLGVVRWLRGDKRKGTTLGIQFIKGDIQAVTIRARKGNRIETTAQPALLVSGEEMHGLASPTVVAQRGLYQDGRQLVLTIGVEALSVRARMRVEATPMVERFFYQVYHHDDIEARSPSSNSEDDEGPITLDNVPLPGDH